MSWGRRLQVAAAIVFIVGYAGLSHYSNTVGQARGLGVALTLLPLLSIGCWLVWRSGHRWIALLLGVAAALLLIRFRVLLENNLTIIYLLQECLFYGLMAASFGWSLRAGHVALCTRFADKVHGPLTPQELRYTRQVTAAWVLFFVLMTAATLGLYLFSPLRVWSVFANFCSLPLVALMFAGEYAVRRRVLPQVKPGILSTLRVYFADSP
jgi:uncharacterized membrane protein